MHSDVDVSACFPLQVCVAVWVFSREAVRSVALELRHGAAVSGHPGPQPLQRQQGGEPDGESAARSHQPEQRRSNTELWMYICSTVHTSAKDDEKHLFLVPADKTSTSSTCRLYPIIFSNTQAPPPFHNRPLYIPKHHTPTYPLIKESLISWKINCALVGGAVCVYMWMCVCVRGREKIVIRALSCPGAGEKLQYLSSVLKMVPADSSGGKQFVLYTHTHTRLNHGSGKRKNILL